MGDLHISYRAGYKYQLAEQYIQETEIVPESDIEKEFINLEKNGKLTIKSGYAWDGTTGPIDTRFNLRASLVHDAFYQLMRTDDRAKNINKDSVDLLFKNMCKEDGVLSLIARIYYEILKRLGKPFVDPKNAKKVKK